MHCHAYRKYMKYGPIIWTLSGSPMVSTIQGFHCKFNSCLNTAFAKCQCSNLKAFCACVETHAMHDTRSAGLKKLFRVSIYSMLVIRTVNNCWIPAFTVQCSCSAWFAVYRGKGMWLLCPCEKSVACGFVRACFTLTTAVLQLSRQICVGYVHQHNMTTPIPGVWSGYVSRVIR